jgi:hypothetical protein
MEALHQTSNARAAERAGRASETSRRFPGPSVSLRPPLVEGLSVRTTYRALALLALRGGRPIATRFPSAPKRRIWVPPLGYQAIAYRLAGLQPALWVEHAAVEDERWLLMLLSPDAPRPPSGDPVSPCSAKILFIFYSFHFQKRVGMNKLADSIALVEPASKEASVH